MSTWFKDLAEHLTEQKSLKKIGLKIGAQYKTLPSSSTKENLEHRDFPNQAQLNNRPTH